MGTVTQVDGLDEDGINPYLKKDVKLHKKRYLLCLFITGFWNNFGYVLVGSSAQNIANHFDKGDFMSLFSLCLIGCSGLTRLFNSKFLLNIIHKIRIAGMLMLSMTGYAIIGVANFTDEIWGFYLALIGSVIVGISCALGESVILGFLKAYPSDLVVGWSSGTGLAGIGGAGIYLLLHSLEIPDKIVFLVLIPFHIIEWLSFLWVNRRRVIASRAQERASFSQRKEGNSINDKSANLDENATNEYLLASEKEEATGTETNVVERQRENSVNQQESNVNLKLNFTTFKITYSKIGLLSFNLFLVYFLEYSCTVGFADRANPKTENQQESWARRNAYVLLSFCYQFGVLLSRSSLYLIKVRRVWIVTALQVINFVFWFFVAYYKFMSVYLQFLLMIWVGLMGGCSYVNVMFNILEKKDVTRGEKELAMNICTCFNDFGVLLATIFVLIMDNTFMK